MDEQEKLKRAQNITNKIEAADRILIISSKPVDVDTLCTSLTLQWWIQKQYDKKVEIVTFVKIPESYKKEVTAVEGAVQEKYPNKVKFEEYDLIIVIDANAWYMVVTLDYSPQDLGIDFSKTVHIDHHPVNEIHKDLGENSLTFRDSCTSKIVYNYFIKPSGIKIPTFAANWMYKSLLGDTGQFDWEVYPGTYTYAEELLTLGAEHQKLVEKHIPKDQMEYLKILLPKITYHPDIESQILIIDELENDLLSETFGNDWSQNRLYSYLNEVVYRRIEGFNYGLTFTKDFRRGGVDASWRARNVGELVSVQRVLESLGFEAGGHPGAGGGYGFKLHISDIKEQFIERMKEALQDKSSYQLSASSDQK